MNKRGKMLLSIGLVAAVLLIGCGSEDTSANVVSVNTTSSIDTDPYEVIGEEEIHGTDVVKLRDKETGCYYLYSYQGGLTQMYDKTVDNRAVPYCKK